jgi:hypothetical protein
VTNRATVLIEWLLWTGCEDDPSAPCANVIHVTGARALGLLEQRERRSRSAGVNDRQPDHRVTWTEQMRLSTDAGDCSKVLVGRGLHRKNG